MTIDYSAASLRPPRVGLSVLVAALFSSIAVAAPEAQESSIPEPDAGTRSIRPTTALTTRPKVQAADVPTVRLVSPRPLVLKIGSSYSILNLSGTHLRRVMRATVVKSDGQVADGFNVRIGSRNRTDARLLLSLIAGKLAAPGDYSLRLTYELDDPRPQTSPTTSRRRPIVRTVTVPRSTVTIRAKAMSPRITSVTPESPQLGPEWEEITVAVDDLPGNELLSVRRFKFSGSNLAYCDFKGTDQSPNETHRTTWRGEHSLKIAIVPGTLFPRGGDTCSLRFTLRTRNELGEEFYSIVDKTITFRPDPRKAYAVTNTWELQKYLRFKLQHGSALGVCSGTSLGTSGQIPVGLVKGGGDINLRIRSGPVGTNCTWMVYVPTGLRPGWEMRMTFEKEQIGSKCDSGPAPQRGNDPFEFDRTAGFYHRSGVLTLSVGNPNGVIPHDTLENAGKSFRYTNLICSPTVTNDHGVTMRMVSAELFGRGGPNCTWKCGVED